MRLLKEPRVITISAPTVLALSSSSACTWGPRTRMGIRRVAADVFSTRTQRIHGMLLIPASMRINPGCTALIWRTSMASGPSRGSVRGVARSLNTHILWWRIKLDRVANALRCILDARKQEEVIEKGEDRLFHMLGHQRYSVSFPSNHSILPA
jgi:hypothetical protein